MTKTMKIVEQDSWLNPVSDRVTQRYQQFCSRYDEIVNRYGSLQEYASLHHFLGFQYDNLRHGWWYREWAPAAHYLSLTGDFNQWQRYANPMDNVGNGIWELFLPDSKYSQTLVHGSLLKVVVQSSIGEHERIPVYATRAAQDDTTKDFAAMFWNPPTRYQFHHATPDLSSQPLLIYETHVGMAQEKEAVGTFNEFTNNVLPVIVRDGYNAIQLMAVAEHPYYGSFGYHVSNFFAVSSRFGTPEDLMSLIDNAHAQGLIVIMDLVHSHTVKNVREGINLFDGTDYQYFVSGEKGNHPLWDSKLFDYAKEETQRFLLSNVRYWLEEFHFDGFRFDGVTSMLYQHHGVGKNFERPDDYFGPDVNNDAVLYLQLANTLVHDIDKQAVTIAEDVSGMPGLCKPIADGGIGFDYRLGMGIPDFWIRILKDLPEEQWNMHEFFFTMTNRLSDVKTVAYAESHDQALVGDKTIAFRLMDKAMYTAMDLKSNDLTVDRGIALHKMIRFFTISLGGDAWLNFMGNEFGHPEWIDFPRLENNWSYHYARRQWSLAQADYLKYKWLGNFDKAMLDFVKHYQLLSAQPAWLLLADETNKTIVFERQNMIFVFNWGQQSIPGYRIPVRRTGDYKIVFTTDSSRFGGFENINTQVSFPSLQESESITIKIYNVSRSASVYCPQDLVKSLIEN